MNERIEQLKEQAFNFVAKQSMVKKEYFWENIRHDRTLQDKVDEKFAELIVKEMCGMMEQAEDDSYHCFEPSERPTEYIEWLTDWQTRFKEHFGVEE